MESIWNGFFDPRSEAPITRPPPRRSVPEAPVTRTPVRRSPKVVSVPVRFVCSEQQRSDAAEKIQRALRGFLVRKCVSRIAAAKREVDEIEAEISRPETAEAIQREPRERLRLNETLMRSLLKLDAIRGVDSGVRDCRKAVIKKAIALQERIDSIAAAIATAENLKPESEANESESVQMESVETEEKHDSQEEKGNENEASEAKESKEDSETSSESESESESATESPAAAEKEGAKPEKMAVERILEENKRLIGMVAELCDRSAAQSRLLSSLSERVELLERAYVSDKLRRKKKKQRRGGCDSNVYKNCGNRS